MTIPILPGPWSALGQGLQGGLDAYNREQDQQYQRAENAARLIFGMVQAGRLDPNAITDPALAQTMQRAQIPVPSQENIVPSEAAMKARETQKVLAGTQPGAAGQPARMITLGIQGLPSQVSEEDLKTFLTNLQREGANDPAMGRRLAQLLPPGVAGRMELAQQAEPTPGESMMQARKYIAGAWMASGAQPSDKFNIGAIAQRAMDAAGRDPAAQQMIASGQLNIGHFANAAQELAQQGEENRIKWAQAWAAGLRAQNAGKDFYSNQIRAYDSRIQQLQEDQKLNVLDLPTQAMLNTAKMKQAKGVQLNSFEVTALQKEAAQKMAQDEVATLMRERQDLLDQYIGARNPINPEKVVVPPQGTAPAIRRGQTYPAPKPYRGHAGPAEPLTGAAGAGASVRTKGGLDQAAAPPVRTANESDAMYWQRLYNLGYDEKEAQSIVEASKRK